MVVKLPNYRIPLKSNGERFSYAEIMERKNILPFNAKMLAWGLFLVFFIENGTLGLLPKNMYFIYRNVRISDLLIYGLTIYSLFNVKEYIELYSSKTLLVVKLILVYLLAQFIISTILYEQDFIEYFFRLKGVWTSVMIFPFLLLLKRKALGYLIKIILPVAIVSNILYIISALTGIALLPDIGIEKANIPGGFKVYRVFGGTFFGETFFLAFVYKWLTDKFKFYQLPLALLFITPHILAFGRSAWVFFLFSIAIIMLWNFLKNRDFKIMIRQAVVIVMLIISSFYVFTKFVPQSDYLTDAISARIIQGQEDYEHQTGTYGTRLANINALLNLWQNTNILFGIGMHPMWVISPKTEEEIIYIWGFSDIRWASVLAAYGLVGFLLAVIFQLYYGYLSVKILVTTRSKSLYTFFVLMMFSGLLFDTFINYSYKLISVSLWGLSAMLSFTTAATIYKAVYADDEKTERI